MRDDGTDALMPPSHGQPRHDILHFADDFHVEYDAGAKARQAHRLLDSHQAEWPRCRETRRHYLIFGSRSDVGLSPYWPGEGHLRGDASALVDVDV